MNETVLMGVHPELTKAMLDYRVATVIRFSQPG